MALRFRFDRLEFAGSLGDLGTLLPIALAMILVKAPFSFKLFSVHSSRTLTYCGGNKALVLYETCAQAPSPPSLFPFSCLVVSGVARK